MAKLLARVAAAGLVGGWLLGSPPAGAAEGGKATKKHDSSKPSRPSRTPDASARRTIAGGPAADDATAGAESPELRALREAERELFPAVASDVSVEVGGTRLSSLQLLPPLGEAQPRVLATGMPPAQPTTQHPSSAAKDTAWLSQLEMPDIPVRWDDRVVRYVEFFRDDPRGRTTFSNLFRHSGRWRDMIRRGLRRKSLPEDLVWVSMIESGFDPTAHSAAAAAGLWQFTAETAKVYGLAIDRWVDRRLDPEAETDAAADLLGDLHRRFGSWDLALAAYDMGYAGLTAVVRRYNTNDFWSLSRAEGSLPWETTLYVPKILAAAVVAHNLAAFGLSDLVLDPAVETEEVAVPAGTSLAVIGAALGVTAKDVQALNPELRAGRTPPLSEGDVAYPVKVARGKGPVLMQALAKMHGELQPLERYVVRFGETLEQVALAHKTTVQKLVDYNAIAPGEAIRGGTTLLVPKVDSAAMAGNATPAPPPAGKQSVVVPPDIFVYPDRKRVFYRVLAGDTLREIASALHVPPDDLDRWNDLDPSARLAEGMTLQAFVPADADLSRVVVLAEGEVRVLPVGSEEFFGALEHEKGMHRVVVRVRTGDTLESIGKHFDVPVRTMERINRRGRNEALKEGETVVVYVPNGTAVAGGTLAANTPVTSVVVTPNPPLSPPPLPSLLP
jgi:membrane-bound lytic murein transglycosylase D